MNLDVADIRRAFEILVKGPKLIPDPGGQKDLAQVARDIRISTLSKRTFLALGVFLLAGSSVSLFALTTLTASLLAVSMLISFAVSYRFARLLSSEDVVIEKPWIDYAMNVLKSSQLNWGSNKVPYINKGHPPGIHPGSTFDAYFKNLVRIFQIIHSNPSYTYNAEQLKSLRTVLDKCWAFALEQSVPQNYLKACVVCESLQRHLFDPDCKEGHCREIILKFPKVGGDDIIPVPDYLRKLLLKNDEFRLHMGANAADVGIDEITFGGISYHDFFKKFMTLFFNGSNLNQLEPILVKWYTDLFQDENNRFVAILKWLETLKVNQIHLLIQQTLTYNLQIPKSLKVDENVIRRMQKAKLILVSRRQLTLTPPHLNPETLTLLKGLHLTNLKVIQATQETLKLLSEWPDLTELYLQYPHYDAHELGSLPESLRKKLREEVLGEKLVDAFSSLPVLNVEELTYHVKKEYVHQISPLLVEWFEKLPKLKTLMIFTESVAVTNPVVLSKLRDLKMKRPEFELKINGTIIN